MAPAHSTRSLSIRSYHSCGLPLSLTEQHTGSTAAPKNSWELPSSPGMHSPRLEDPSQVYS